jgi:hypothetical protein
VTLPDLSPTSLAAAPRSPRVRVIRPPSFQFGQLAGHLVRLGEYAGLLLTLTLHRIRVRYKQSALGLGWALVQPLALMLIYTVIFSVVTRMPSDGSPYAVFVYTALLPWTFFATAVTSAANGLVSHTQLITKVYFPREILPEEPGLIVCDAFGGAVLREAPSVPLAGARRKALTVAFGRLAAMRAAGVAVTQLEG